MSDQVSSRSLLLTGPARSTPEGAAPTGGIRQFPLSHAALSRDAPTRAFGHRQGQDPFEVSIFLSLDLLPIRHPLACVRVHRLDARQELKVLAQERFDAFVGFPVSTHGAGLLEDRLGAPHADL
jgi:hypothetical protein